MKPIRRNRTLVLGLFLLSLAVANVVFRLGSKTTGQSSDYLVDKHPPGFFDGGGAPEFQAKVQAALEKLNDSERAEVEARLAKDREFFDSLQALPAKERPKAIQAYISENPPPQIPGLEPPPAERGRRAAHGLVASE